MLGYISRAQWVKQNKEDDTMQEQASTYLNDAHYDNLRLFARLLWPAEAES